MATPGDIPKARALGGAGGGRSRWLTREVVRVDRKVDVILAGQCACCCRTIPSGDHEAYCKPCRWHQRVYAPLVVASWVGCGWLGWHAGSIGFAATPFAGKILHTALAFLLALAAPVLVVAVANLLRADPRHGHWGRSVQLRGAGRAARTVFRQPSYGRALASQLGLDGVVREVREPRSGWRLVVGFVLVIPAASAVHAFLTHDRNQIQLYVDNHSDREVVIGVIGRGEVARVEAGRTRAVRLPRMAMTLAATSAGTEIERITIGGLAEILAGDYPELFPDLEYDVGDVFVWNLLSLSCYRESTRAYGSAIFTPPPTVHQEKALISPTDHPFQAAPSSVQSSLPMDIRDELVRVPCP